MIYYIRVLQNYADFTGRARRKEYWYFGLFSVLISITVNYLGYVLDFIYLGNIYSLAVLIPSIAVGVRRMHDVDKSGWYLLVPIYNLILAFTEGTKGSNGYGYDPKGDDLEDQIEQW